MKLKNIILAGFATLLFSTSCQKGLVYSDVPESVYNEVELGTGFCQAYGRELFEGKVYQVNYEKYTDILLTVSISDPYKNGGKYKNETSSDIVIMGTTLAPGEEMDVKNSIVEVADASAPEGKKYVLNIFVQGSAEYKTPNKGHLFDQSKFAGDAVQPEFIAIEGGKSQSIIMPIRQNDMIVAIILKDQRSCKVEPVGNAPVLGVPGDYTKPHQYMVTNTVRRPDGAPAKQRLYEIVLQLLP